MTFASEHILGVREVKYLSPYEVDKQGTVEYRRYTDGKHRVYRQNILIKEEDEKELIERVTVDGSITRYEKAWDLWANRTSATYIPINSCFDFDRTIQ